MSRLRRVVLSSRFFFVTCRVARPRSPLGESEFACLAGVIRSRREKERFLLTAWVFLPDPWQAILFPRQPATLSGVMESIKVSSTRLIHNGQGETGRVWQGRCFDRTLRTVKEDHEKVEYIHLNPVKAGRVSHAKDWLWSNVHDYTGSLDASAKTKGILAVDRFLLPADERTRI